MSAYLYPHLMSGCSKDRFPNSVALDSASSRHCSRTPAPGANKRKLIARVIFKLGKADNTQRALLGVNLPTNPDQVSVYNSQLYIQRAGWSLASNRLLRDPTAWYDLILPFDIDNGTAGNRLRPHINGVEITSWASDQRANFAGDLYFNNSAYTNYLGAWNAGAFFDGGISLVEWIDAADFVLSDFGLIDPKNGNWRPHYYKGALNAYSSRLTFSNAASLGADSSGAGNNWTPVNITSDHQSKDSATNYKAAGGDYRGNYCTLSAVDKGPSIPTAQDCGLRQVNTTVSSQMVCGTVAVSKGKWYFEVVPKTAGCLIGVVSALQSRGVAPGQGLSWACNADNGNKVSSGSSSAYGGAYNGSTDVMCVALDMDAGKIWLGKNGVFPAGDPAVGTGAAFTNLLGHTVAACLNHSSVVTFGQRPFAFAPPAGYYPLTIAAMPKPAIVKPSLGFVQAVDSGVNISAALAAKRSGWGSDYIDVIKRLDSSEGFRWRFGDDSANYIDTTNTANGKQAFPALAGTSYLGAALRVGAQYGVRTGEVAHVNGAATTITNSAGTTRKAIVLRRVDAAGQWYYHHPDLTAGSLLRWNSTAAEAADSSITAITSNSWDIGAGAATGTYRYIELIDTPGFLALRKMKGNDSADGAYSDYGFRPGLTLISDRNATNLTGAILHASARNPFNGPDSLTVELGDTRAESGLSGIRNLDFTATGSKRRNAASGLNSSSYEYVEIAFAEAAFATGDCAAQGLAR